MFYTSLCLDAGLYYNTHELQLRLPWKRREIGCKWELILTTLPGGTKTLKTEFMLSVLPKKPNLLVIKKNYSPNVSLTFLMKHFSNTVFHVRPILSVKWAQPQDYSSQLWFYCYNRSTDSLSIKRRVALKDTNKYRNGVSWIWFELTEKFTCITFTIQLWHVK